VSAKVRALLFDVYRVTKNFPRDERYGAVAQMRRAAFGIGLAIAEGCGRATGPDYIRFLTYANGSAQEIECAADQSIDLEFGDRGQLEETMAAAQEVQKILCAMIATLKRREAEKKRRRRK
jgi:four helix bundle protein